MESFLNWKSKLMLRIIAWYQIAGGLAGIGLMLIVVLILIRTAPLSLATFIMLVAVALHGFSVYCGVLLLKNKYRKGLNLSVINQALQLVSVAIGGYGYKYIAGVAFLAGFNKANSPKVYISFSWRPSWQISISAGGNHVDIAINIIALLLLVFMIYLRGSINKQKLLHERHILL
jgi:hypothetical protein